MTCIRWLSLSKICAMLWIQSLLLPTVLLAALLVLLLSDGAAARQNHAIEVALTVDDLPGWGRFRPGAAGLRSQDMIRTLKANGVSAYGFANGVQLDADPPQVEVLKDWANAGFAVGNHTFNHLNLWKMDAPAYIANIQRMDQRLAALDLSDDQLSVRRMFRYPYLAEGDTLAKRNAVRNYLFGNGYRIAEVTVDFYDWAWNDAYTQCLARNDSAALELFRKRSADSALSHLNKSVALARMLFSRDIRHVMLTHMGAFEADELGEVLERYRAAGVRFITLNQAMEDPVYDLNPNYAYAATDKTFLQQIAASRKLRDPYRDPIGAPDKIAVICR